MSERDIFIVALQAENPAERHAYLDEACSGQPELRQQVEQLLRLHEGAGTFLERPAAESANTRTFVDTAEATPQPEAGNVVGPYKLIELIGDGGMGSVWMAQQSEPVKRLVAVKLIKAGMDSRQVVARFEAERQALALMDHTNIARVLDAGTTSAGRPYFVMDLVKGVPITRYCDEHRLTPRQRLELFIPVCEAVQHAHQKGVIHRDLKPSNVLVALYDGKPVPKVIDFGVAKATGQSLTEKTLATGFGAIVGTLEYMSPEQAQINQLDIDTRSDIYALGVLLYELLTGSPPFSRPEVEKAGMLEALRVIREQEPSKPSTKLSTAEGLPTLAANRGTEPAKLKRLVRGELDWIVMKALEKDRNRRYETAASFAADVRRYLDDEPVQAGPPSAWYRFGKLARRNTAALCTAALVAASLLAGIAIATWQAVRATTAMAATALEKRRADRQAATATRINASLKQMLGLLHPDSDKGRDYTVLQLLDDYSDNLEENLADEPTAAADLHTAVGLAYACRGQNHKARGHLQRALELARGVFGDQHPKFADKLVDLMSPEISASEPLERREAELRRALAIYRESGVGGEPVIRALWMLQWNLLSTPVDRIEPVLEEAVAEARKWPGVIFSKSPTLYGALAGIKRDRGQYSEAEHIAREALEMQRKLGKRSSDLAWAYYGLGETQRPQGKFAAALAAEKEALSIMRTILPPEHPGFAFALNAAGRTLDGADKRHALADVFPSLVELDEWESNLRQIVATTQPGAHNYTDPVQEAVFGLARLVRYYRLRGEQWAACGQTRPVEEARRKALGVLDFLAAPRSDDPAHRADFYAYATVALMRAGQPQQANDFGRKLLDETTVRRDAIANGVAWSLANAEHPEQRNPSLAVELAQKAVAADSKSSARRNTLGVARYRAGDYEHAATDLEHAVAMAGGGSSFDFFFLAMAHWRLGNKNQARSWYAKAVDWMDKRESRNEELLRYRAEAAELLNVNPKSD
jgi:serine/threonine protein kinase